MFNIKWKSQYVVKAKVDLFETLWRWWMNEIVVCSDKRTEENQFKGNLIDAILRNFQDHSFINVLLGDTRLASQVHIGLLFPIPSKFLQCKKIFRFTFKSSEFFNLYKPKLKGKSACNFQSVILNRLMIISLKINFRDLLITLQQKNYKINWLSFNQIDFFIKNSFS